MANIVMIANQAAALEHERTTDKIFMALSFDYVYVLRKGDYQAPVTHFFAAINEHENWGRSPFLMHLHQRPVTS